MNEWIFRKEKKETEAGGFLSIRLYWAIIWDIILKKKNRQRKDKWLVFFLSVSKTTINSFTTKC